MEIFSRAIKQRYGQEKMADERKDETPNLDQLLAESAKLKNSGESDDTEELSPAYSPWTGLSNERAEQRTQQYAYAYLFENGRCHLFSN